MDAYMQECGRAGRDGKPAKCILCMCFRCVSLPNPTTIHVEILVYSYWDTLHALSGAEPNMYARAIKDALPIIKMAEAPWTCRRIPILTYYGERPGPAYTCGNCDVCFAADSGLPRTTNIKQDVERIKDLFGRPGQREFVTRTAIRKKLSDSSHTQRVVEYLVFKGVLKEFPYMNHNILRCGLKMVRSKSFRKSNDVLTMNQNQTTGFPSRTHQHACPAPSTASKPPTAPKASKAPKASTPPN